MMSSNSNRSVIACIVWILLNSHSTFVYFGSSLSLIPPLKTKASVSSLKTTTTKPIGIQQQFNFNDFCKDILVAGTIAGCAFTTSMSQLQQPAFAAFDMIPIASTTETTALASLGSTTTSFSSVSSSSSILLAEKITREGIYGEYEVDLLPQTYDDARSTFKAASETKSNKGKYTALIAILVVGSFIIPMAQYFWYVRDDDSSDKFFAQNVPEPPPSKKKTPPTKATAASAAAKKKNSWFG